MNCTVFAMRRPVKSVMLVAALVSGGALGLSNMRADTLPTLNTPKTHGYVDSIGMRVSQMKAYIVGHLESCFQKHKGEHHQEHRRIVLTSPKVMDVTVSQRYVCQIHSRRHIEVRALEDGYLDKILVGEGQAVKTGDVMFRIRPTLYQARLNAELAEAQYAQREYDNTKMLFDQKMVSDNELTLLNAKLAKAKAKAELAKAELDFTNVTAPFDGIVDRLHEQLGSLIKERDMLTTLSDNSVMWVYFNVPEAQYLDYMAGRGQHEDDERIELVLANDTKFPITGKIGAIEAKFNNETGNIAFRADFPNTPDRLLRHGQTGDVLIHRVLHDAIVIPQQATFEVLDKLYVYVVDNDNVVHQRRIAKRNEMEDIFVLKSGVDVNDKIVLDGVQQVRDGETVEAEFQPPEVALANQKYHAE